MSTSYIKSSGDLVLQTNTEINFFGTVINSDTVPTYGAVPVSNLNSVRSSSASSKSLSAGAVVLEDANGDPTSYVGGSVTQDAYVIGGSTTYITPVSVWVDSISKYLAIYYDTNTSSTALDLYDEGGTSPTYSTTTTSIPQTNLIRVYYESTQQRVFVLFKDGGGALNISELAVTASSITVLGNSTQFYSSTYGLILEAAFNEASQFMVAVFSDAYEYNYLTEIAGCAILYGNAPGDPLTVKTPWIVAGGVGLGLSAVAGCGVGLSYVGTATSDSYEHFVMSSGVKYGIQYTNGLSKITVDPAQDYRIYRSYDVQIHNTGGYDHVTLTNPTDAVSRIITIYELNGVLAYNVHNYDRNNSGGTFSPLSSGTISLPVTLYSGVPNAGIGSQVFAEAITESKILCSLLTDTNLGKGYYVVLDYNSSTHEITASSDQGLVDDSSTSAYGGRRIALGPNSARIDIHEVQNSQYRFRNLNIATAQSLSGLTALGVSSSNQSSGTTVSYVTLGKVYSHASSLGLSAGKYYYLGDSGLRMAVNSNVYSGATSLEKFLVIALDDRSYKIVYAL